MPQSQQHIPLVISEPIGSDSSLILVKNANQLSTWNSNPLGLVLLQDSQKNLPPAPFTKKKANDSFPLFFIYFGIVLLWAIFYRNNFKTVQNIGKSFISNTAFNQLLNERRSFNGMVSIGMFLLGLLVISIFSLLVIQYNYPEINTHILHDSKGYIFLILASLITLTFIKSLVIGISAWVFSEQSALTGYLSLQINSIQILGIVLLPASILFSYSHTINALYITFLGASLMGIVFLYRIIRTFFLAVKETNSQVFHIILYICALEILPLIVISKLVIAH